MTEHRDDDLHPALHASFADVQHNESIAFPLPHSASRETDDRHRMESGPSLYGSMMVPRRLLSLARRFRALPQNEQTIVVNACRQAVVDRQREYSLARSESFAWYPTEPLVVNTRATMTPDTGAVGGRPPDDEGQALLGASLTQDDEQPKEKISVVFEKSWQHLVVILDSRRYYVHLPTLLARILMIFALWVFLVLAIGSPMLPGGWLFDPLSIVFFSGMIGGVLSVALHIPPLLGILWAAILLGNIRSRNLSHNIHEAVTVPVKAFALALILIRGGLSININLLRPMMRNVAVLSLLPLFLEAAGNAAVVYYLFGMDDAIWALLTGFTMAVISPNTVVDLLHLQSSGHGTFGGPTLLMLSAIPFDTAVGIWAATFLQGLALRESTSFPLVIIVTAPLQFIGGILLGVLLGVGLERLMDFLYDDRGPGGKFTTDGHSEMDVTLLYQVRGRCFQLVMILAAMLMMACRQVDMEGAGALCVVAMSATLSHRWERRGREGQAQKLSFSLHAAEMWNVAAMPALFAFTGAMVDLGQVVDTSFLPKALSCVAIGMACRCAGAAASSKDTDLSWRETIVLCFGWVGKASVQATLAVVVYDRAKTMLAHASSPSDKARFQLYLNRGILVTQLSVVMILIGSVVSVVAIRWLGIKWVRKDV